MSNLQKRKESGFTIIEVLIVLAIAGLIMLIVFLAVPALQRNARNTTNKNDASSVEGGINEYVSNNDGSFPTGVAGTGTVVISGTGTSTNAKVNGSTQVSVVAAAPTSISTGTINVVLGKNCAGQASTRAAAIYYAVESPGATNGVSVKCLDN